MDVIDNGDEIVLVRKFSDDRVEMKIVKREKNGDAD